MTSHFNENSSTTEIPVNLLLVASLAFLATMLKQPSAPITRFVSYHHEQKNLYHMFC